MITYLKRITDRANNLFYYKLKIKTNIYHSLTNEEIFELEDMIEKYLNKKQK